MPRTKILRVRIEPDLKHDAEEILSSIGLANSQAIGLFYKQIILNNGLPFELKIPDCDTRFPNEKLQEAMLDVILKRNLKEFSSIEEFERKYS